MINKKCYFYSGVVSGSLSCLAADSDGGCDPAMPPTAMRLDSPPCTHNNNNNNNNNNNEKEKEKEKDASGAELELLAKLEEANRLYESDAKSLNSLSGASGHSRKGSDTSQISLTSGNYFYTHFKFFIIIFHGSNVLAFQIIYYKYSRLF